MLNGHALNDGLVLEMTLLTDEGGGVNFFDVLVK